jgi:D-psicose/D-tagatose/L-ribulose 3-epimerase
MDYVRHCIDAAKTVGAKNVIGPLTAPSAAWQSTDDSKRDTDLLVRQLGRLSRYAATAASGCRRTAQSIRDSHESVSQAIEVVDRVDHPACGILLDTFHMNIEERSIGDAIRAAGKRVRQIHTCENDRGAPGSGHVPWQEVAKACRDIGFDGPYVIESFTNKVKSIARAAAIWRNFAPTQDALAEDGLKFLRKLLS